MTGQAQEMHDVVIVGGGPSGLAAARRMIEQGVSDVVVLEREREAGGIPRHCHHTGYGLREFGRLMSGLRFAERSLAAAAGADMRTGVTVTKLAAGGRLELATPEGPRRIAGRRVLLALGVRETPRPPRLVSGTRPWGVTTTGALQQMVYLNRQHPFRHPVIVGSELVSFSALLTLRSAGVRAAAMIEENARITARRPGDLIARLLFGVPVLTSTRLVAIEGGSTVEGVVVERAGRDERIACDGVIFTGHFRPETSLLRDGVLALDPGSGGPLVDQYGRCSDPTYFACGNLVHPVETAGYCYREGLRCGEAIALDLAGRLPDASARLRVRAEGALRYLCPQLLAMPQAGDGGWQLNARAASELRGRLTVTVDGREIWARQLHALPERRIAVPLAGMVAGDAHGVAVRLDPV
jgi:NADPH-dependent 2,4-dienoyl-CoA reductase/sulfur reductase-like enzyme